MSVHMDQHLLDEICTLKHGHEIWVGQIVNIQDDQFEVKLLEERVKTLFLGQQPLWITIETITHEIHLLDVEILSDSIQENDRILSLKAISDLKFQSKRQEPRLPLTQPTEIYYREFPPRYHTWEEGRLINISLGGALFTGECYVSQGSLIEIKLGPPFFGDEDDEVVISRNVNAISDSGQYYFSIQFLNLQETHQKQLRKYIETIFESLKDYTEIHE